MIPDIFINNKITLLSPHYDDIVFSLGGLLPAFVNHSDCQVINIFSVSNFLYGCVDELEKSTAMRKNEDKIALNGLGIREIKYAGFQEALIRDKNRKALFLDYPHETITSTDMMLIEKIANYLGIIPLDHILLLPACFGGHIDHLLLQLATKELKHTKLYYADLPYASNDSCYLNSYGYRFTRSKQSITVEIDTNVLELHLATCRKYYSQFEHEFTISIKEFLNKNGFVIWI